MKKDIIRMRGTLMRIVTRLWEEFPNLDQTIGYSPELVRKVERRYIAALKDVIRIAGKELKRVDSKW